MEQQAVNEDDFTVFVGNKDTKVYVFSVTTQAEKYERLLIKARGKAISKAVDTSQIAINKFLNGWALGRIIIGTERREQRGEYSSPGREDMDVSVIEIEIIKNGR